MLARVKFPLIRTFDSSRTPQRDKRIAARRTLAAVDVSAVVAALAEIEGRLDDSGTRMPPETWR